MNTRQFDTWVQQIAVGAASRRTALRIVIGAALGSLASPVSRTVDAKRRRKKRKKKKKVTFNAFGCVDVGKFCKTGGQCCSGICEGKKDKKTCQAHDQSTCQPGLDFCLNEPVDCTTTANEFGSCATTTGQAGYCFDDGLCFPCTKDADCSPVCGNGAACVVCSDCQETGGTACVGFGDCTLGD